MKLKKDQLIFKTWNIFCSRDVIPMILLLFTKAAFIHITWLSTAVGAKYRSCFAITRTYFTTTIIVFPATILKPSYEISCQRWSFIAEFIVYIYYSSALLWCPGNFKNCNTWIGYEKNKKLKMSRPGLISKYQLL